MGIIQCVYHQTNPTIDVSIPSFMALAHLRVLALRVPHPIRYGASADWWPHVRLITAHLPMLFHLTVFVHEISFPRGDPPYHYLDVSPPPPPPESQSLPHPMVMELFI